MLKEKKAQAVDKLEEDFSRSTVAIVTDYRGLSASEMTKLRRRFREAGIEYRVVKNTLARFAADRAGREGIKGFFSGPTAIVLSYVDEAKPAQLLAEYIRTAGKPLQVKGGMMGERVLTTDDISMLATLPSREILVSQLMGGLQMPLLLLLNVLNAPLQGLMRILQAKIKQMEV